MMMMVTKKLKLVHGHVVRCKDFAYVSHLNNVAYQINIENTIEIVVTIYCGLSQSHFGPMGMQDGDMIKHLEGKLAAAMKQIENMQSGQTTPSGSKGTPSSAVTTPSPSQLASQRATPKSSATPKAAAKSTPIPKATPKVGEHTYGDE